MRTLFLILFAFFLIGCIRYSEEWHFNKNGSGTVQIICEPSPDWMKHAGATNWIQAALLFLPPYKSLSQEFSRAGVEFEQCKFVTKKGKPRVNMLISFKSLASISRTSLFSDRLLQWRKNPFKVTMLHRLSTTRPLGKAEMASIDDGILSDATFDVKMYLPGRIISVDGAEKKGNCAFVQAKLSQLAMGESIIIKATARTGYPLWQKLLLIVIIAIPVALVVFYIFKKFVNNSDISNGNSTFNTQSL